MARQAQRTVGSAGQPPLAHARRVAHWKDVDVTTPSGSKWSMRGFRASVLAAGALACGSAGVASADPGDLDPSFGSGGSEVTPFTGGAFGHAVAVQSDGAVVEAGTMNATAGNRFAIARYTPQGMLDQ